MTPANREQNLSTPGKSGAWESQEGAPAPLGATWLEEEGAWNFALYSRSAAGVTLLLYRPDDTVHPVLQKQLDRLVNKTGRIWHCRLKAAAGVDSAYYAYRVEGPAGDEIRFDREKILLDPYAPAVFFPPGFDRKACQAPGPTDGKAPLGVLPRSRPDFDWTGDRSVRHRHDTVVYELHVKGFTARANSGVAPEKRGTFAGLVEKIPYLQELGVSVVELLPIHQYDPQEKNYWGYMTLHFFSPHATYAHGEAFDELRETIKAFHAAGIEVWLDVVYNHTSEIDETGPTYCFRGIDNKSYYLLGPDRTSYVNDTGCGNTLRCGHPAVRRLVTDSLRFWREQMRIDGFRFDLASIFTRNADGSLNLDDPPLVAEISSLGYHSGMRLVAEAWDIGTYQLGHSFPGFTWLQWNGRFRDDIRAFLRGDRGKIPDLMHRLCGSDDLFPDEGPETYRPWQSVNYVTAHDGFCLHDLVAYDRKHNQANGHNNTDGSDYNLSWNCGHEGEIGVPPEVLALRKQQAKNFCALLMLANGTPMFVAGDEFLNTQQGNNNPYNQDNEIAWLDWERRERFADVFRFFKLMIAFRKAHPSIGRSRFWRRDVRWHGVGPDPDLAPHSASLAYSLSGASVGDDDLYVMINGWSQDLSFEIQRGDTGTWRRVVDTALPSPHDIVEPGEEKAVEARSCRVRARSIVVLRAPQR